MTKTNKAPKKINIEEFYAKKMREYAEERLKNVRRGAKMKHKPSTALTLLCFVLAAFVPAAQTQDIYIVTVQIVNGTQPLNASLVQLSGQTEYTNVTDANGIATFYVASGKYILFTDARGEKKQQIITVNANSTFLIDYAKPEPTPTPQKEELNAARTPKPEERPPPYQPPSNISQAVGVGIFLFAIFALFALTVLMPKKEPTAREKWQNRRRY